MKKISLVNNTNTIEESIYLYIETLPTLRRLPTIPKIDESIQNYLNEYILSTNIAYYFQDQHRYNPLIQHIKPYYQTAVLISILSYGFLSLQQALKECIQKECQKFLIDLLQKHEIELQEELFQLSQQYLRLAQDSKNFIFLEFQQMVYLGMEDKQKFLKYFIFFYDLFIDHNMKQYPQIPYHINFLKLLYYVKVFKQPNLNKDIKDVSLDYKISYDELKSLIISLE
ncbi:hypothetical protein pb186bvf_010614 [Paramecium bursaria]